MDDMTYADWVRLDTKEVWDTLAADNDEDDDTN